jgi:hypothetical protein
LLDHDDACDFRRPSRDARADRRGSHAAALLPLPPPPLPTRRGLLAHELGVGQAPPPPRRTAAARLPPPPLPPPPADPIADIAVVIAVALCTAGRHTANRRRATTPQGPRPGMQDRGCWRSPLLLLLLTPPLPPTAADSPLVAMSPPLTTCITTPQPGMERSGADNRPPAAPPPLPPTAADCPLVAMSPPLTARNAPARHGAIRGRQPATGSTTAAAATAATRYRSTTARHRRLHHGPRGALHGRVPHPDARHFSGTRHRVAAKCHSPQADGSYGRIGTLTTTGFLSACLRWLLWVVRASPTLVACPAAGAMSCGP